MRRNIHRFENGERLASYTGPVPSTYESGGKVRKDRKGTAEMDNVPVMNHVRMRGMFYQFFLIKRKKPRKLAYLAVARKLAIVIFKVMKGERYRNPFK